jgi:putative ABC transport system substrate-binding protein
MRRRAFITLVGAAAVGVSLPGLAQQSEPVRRIAIFPLGEWAIIGGLLAYGPEGLDTYRRVPTYIDRILRGADPRELPIREPDKFELVINLKTAKTIGLTIPPSILIRADEVIE